MFYFNKLAGNIKRMFGINKRNYNVRCIYKVLNPGQIKPFIDNLENVILDVREEEEFENMHVKNAINIPVNKLDSNIYNIIQNKNTNVLVYCATGERTNYAICRLSNLGYSNLYIWGNGGINTLTVRDILEYK